MNQKLARRWRAGLLPIVLVVLAEPAWAAVPGRSALATGVGGATNVEYIPYHICSSETVLHRIYHDPQHPSHLLLPMIPNE